MDEPGTYVTDPYKDAVVPFNATALTVERGSTHGRFADNAEVSQMIKEYYRTRAPYEGLTFVQREALDNIAIKISRILSGGNNHDDNWQDIAGYATLAVQELHGE